MALFPVRSVAFSLVRSVALPVRSMALSLVRSVALPVRSLALSPVRSGALPVRSVALSPVRSGAVSPVRSVALPVSAQRVFQNGKMFLGDWCKFFPQYCTQHSERIVLTMVAPQCDLVCRRLTPELPDDES